MKGFKITNINFHQAVTLPAGTYTYSCKARPVGSSITFRVGLTDYVISNLSPGVYQKGIKYTFTVESEQTNFYPSRTVGDEIFEPQLEEGTKATTAGPNILDEQEALSRAGIQITEDMAGIYATKGLLYSEITASTNSIISTVGEIGGRISIVEQTINSWSSTIIDDAGKIASQILQEDGTVKIKAEQIELEGSETAGGNFIVNVDGTIKAKGAEIEGKIMSSAQGQRIIIDPETGGLYMYSDEDAVTGELIHEDESMEGLSLSRAYMILRDWVNEDILVGQEQVIWRSIVVKPEYIKIEDNDFEGQLRRRSFLFADRLYFEDTGGVKFDLRLDPTSGITRLTFGNLPDQSAALTGETYIDSNGFIKVK